MDRRHILVEEKHWECVTMFISICLKLISSNKWNNVKTWEFSKTLENCGFVNPKPQPNGYVQTDVSLELLLNTYRHLHTLLLLKPRVQSFLPDREHVYWAWSHWCLESKPVVHKVSKRTTWPPTLQPWNDTQPLEGRRATSQMMSWRWSVGNPADVTSREAVPQQPLITLKAPLGKLRSCLSFPAFWGCSKFIRCHNQLRENKDKKKKLHLSALSSCGFPLAHSVPRSEELCQKSLSTQRGRPPAEAAPPLDFFLCVGGLIAVLIRLFWPNLLAHGTHPTAMLH